MIIRQLQPNETPPMTLLLLADPSIKSIQSYLNQGDCYLAEEVGVYVLLPLNQETIELKNLAVAPESQGQGFGQALLSHAIQTAQAGGFKRIEVGTGNSSLEALTLYQKTGFIQTAIDRNYFIRHYPDPIIENNRQCRDMIRLSRNL